MKRQLFLAFLAVIVAQLALGSDVKVALSTNKKSFKRGDEIRFKIVFKNTGPHAIRLLPRSEVQSADAITVTNVATQRQARVLRYGEVAVDFQQLSKETVILQPGQLWHRDLRARFASTLPAYFNERRAGLFLVFRGMSAINLPDVGFYSILVDYHSPPNNPVKQYLSDAPPLWEGRAASTPIVVEFR